MLRESEMRDPFVNWLRDTKQIRNKTYIAFEVPWLGRRIDIVTLTSRGILTAYELKLKNNLRAIEQAVKNTHAFHRSYMVTTTCLSYRNRSLATQLDIGVLCMSDASIRRIIRAPILDSSPDVIRRLRSKVRNKAVPAYV